MTDHDVFDVPNRHLSSWTIDALRMSADSLGASARGEAERHLARCARCREAAADSAAAHDRFLAEVLPRTAARLERRVSRRRLLRATMWITPPVLAAAAAFVLALRAPAEREGAPNQTYLAVKGEPSFKMVAKRGERQFEVDDGTALA